MTENHAKGYRRDNEIIQTLTEWGPLDTYQLQQLFFPSLRMAQKRLQKLFIKKKIQRTRDTSERPYAYYVSKFPGQLDHRIGLNGTRIRLQSELKSWETLYCWQYEPGYSIVRPDALMGIKNNVTGKIRFVFIEYDRSNNEFDKVKKYNQWYESERYTSAWWVEHAEKFPSILVVTERVNHVAGLVAKQNKHNLRFEVMPERGLLKCLTANS